ncbi:MAG: hypothetical protein WAN48_06130 [Actinomycetes bacterium]
MTVIALTSAKGSPGVTTTALALAWVWPEVAPGRRVIVVDADMAGGDIAPGYLRGAVSSTDGLLGLASDRSGDRATALWDHVVAMDDEGIRLLLTGISEPTQARSLGGVWSALATVFAQIGDAEPPVDVLLDLGRLGSVHEATLLRERADTVLLVMRSSLTSTAAARPAGRRLREERGADGHPVGLGCVLVGEGQPYRAAEITEAVGVPVAATLAWDPTAAAVLSAGSPANWRFARSPLMRSARAAAVALRSASTSREQDLPQREQVPSAGGGRRHG